MVIINNELELFTTQHIKIQYYISFFMASATQYSTVNVYEPLPAFFNTKDIYFVLL